MQMRDVDDPPASASSTEAPKLHPESPQDGGHALLLSSSRYERWAASAAILAAVALALAAAAAARLASVAAAASSNAVSSPSRAAVAVSIAGVSGEFAAGMLGIFVEMNVAKIHLRKGRCRAERDRIFAPYIPNMTR